MRVLVLSTVYPNPHNPTLGVFVRQRVRHLAERCELQVVAPIPWFPGQRWVRGATHTRVPRHGAPDGFAVHHPPIVSVPGIGKSVDGTFYALSLLPFLTRLRRRFSFDVIDAQFAYPDGFAAVLLGAALRCPVAVTLRGSEVDVATFALRRPQLRFTLQRARVMAVADALRRLAVTLGAAPERVRVIPNAVDAQMFHRRDQQSARAQLGLPPDRTLLLSVGAFIENKGHEQSLEALHRLIVRHPDLLYVAIGSSGGRQSRLPTLRQQMRRLGLQQHVRLEGPRPHSEMPLWMSAADLFCLATRREGWCNSINESLACGLPVITTRVGGNPEVVRDGENGFLVPYNDIDAYSGAIERGLVHPWDRQALSQRASARNWDDVADDVLQELGRVVTGEPSRPSE